MTTVILKLLCCAVLCISFLFVGCVFTTKQSESGFRYDIPILSDELPHAIIAYDFLLNRTSGKGDEHFVEGLPSAFLQRLHSQVTAKDIEWFPHHYAFVLQNGTTGDWAGFKPTGNKMTVPKDKFRRIMFVTTPAEKLAERALVVSSRVSPPRVLIFAVDSDATVEMLYDSYRTRGEEEDGVPSMGFISRVEVTSPGNYVLEERWMLPEDQDIVEALGRRQFELYTVNNEIGISTLSRKDGIEGNSSEKSIWGKK